MLTPAIMGYLALAIVWVNTLLIAASAAKSLFAMLERRRTLRPHDPTKSLEFGLLRGRIVRGDGPGGALASRRVEQIVRSAGDPDRRRSILFADRTFSSEIFGGAVELDGGAGGEAEVAPASEGAEVWIAADAMREAAACPSPERFDAAFEDAKKARGFARTVEARLGPEVEVWIAGDIVGAGARAGASLRVAPSKRHGLLIATVDPRAVLAKNIALSVAAIAGILAAAAGCTALALTRPYFGTLSMIGGALSLAYFLLVQPAGTALRDAVRLPHLAFLRGAWTRKGAVAPYAPDGRYPR